MQRNTKLDLPRLLREQWEKVKEHGLKHQPKPPVDFSSDGCSGVMTFIWWLFPAWLQGWLTWNWGQKEQTPPPWEGGCGIHDVWYWLGGPRWFRAIADRDLREYVKAKGHPVWAWLMWAGVRVGGMWWLPVPSWQWIDGKAHFMGFNRVRWDYGYTWRQSLKRRFAGQI